MSSAINEFPKDTRFIYSWRKYQQQVLDELDKHLADQHLHVIAPPGSGKTILGLEVALRLNKPVLILAPTIAIKKQWILRLCELFLQSDSVPDWISEDIRTPAFMTVATYQGLHAACNNLDAEETEDDEEQDEEETAPRNGDMNLDSILKGLQRRQIATLVLDEAHHLKNAWWNTLTKVKAKLNPVVVALTATPPYDVSPAEWERYLTLNGPVDAEISVPELVIEGDLCPHQDYVHFALPTGKEFEGISTFRANMEMIYREACTDPVIIKAIEEHPLWLNPGGNLDWIYSNLSSYSAALIFMHANGKEISPAHLDVIGDRKTLIPVLNYKWIEILLGFYVYDDLNFKEQTEHRKYLQKRLVYFGAAEDKQVSLLHNRKITAYLATSISKLDSIREIVDFEYRQLDKQLRLVVLADYIRKEFFVAAPVNEMELNKIGIMPIFERLRRDNPKGIKIGVLTGSLMIIPRSALAAFEALCPTSATQQMTTSTVPFDDSYLLVSPAGPLRHHAVAMITKIFQAGEIEVLIGTKSLLGEGWDAPAINALILASFVGSFVLSNQMRGRAIRTQKDNPGKTGNIWHLACIDPTGEAGGDDLQLLRRRFRSFVGVSFKAAPGIENGAGRLDIPAQIHLPEKLEQKNRDTFKFAGDRESLKQRWQTALEAGVQLVEEIKIPFPERAPYKKIKKLYLNKTIAYLIAELFFGLIAFGGDMIELLLQSARRISDPRTLGNLVVCIGVLCFLYFGKQLFTALRLYLKYRDISKDIHAIAEALLNTLIKDNKITTDRSVLEIQTSTDSNGAVYCHLENGTSFEKSLFINSLSEIVMPIDNPRYLILRKSTVMSFVQQIDYHQVPEIIGRNKETAAYFRIQWKKHVGRCNLIYTRTLEGRKLLLKSRIQSLSAQFEEPAAHVNKWK